MLPKERVTTVASNLRTPRRIWAIAALAAIGLALSVSLTQHYYAVKNGTQGFKSYCNINQTMNCDAVAASSYSTFVPGVPLSSLSGGWFLGVFLITLVATSPFWRRETVRALFLMSAIGVLTTLYYLFIMSGVIKTYCIFCLGLDVVNVLLFGLIVSLKPEGLSKGKPELSKWQMISVLALASVVVTVFGLKSLDAGASLDNTEVALEARRVLDSAPVSVDAGENYPSIGPKNAPITIVEFSDYQCPYCRLEAFTLKSLQMRYPNQIRIVFRGFPLDQKCNPYLNHPVHDAACEAAQVGICSNEQGKFSEVYEALFENQEKIAPGKPVEYAVNAGVEITALKACMAKPEVNSKISRDVEAANTLGVQSTPTLFVNGHRAEGALQSPVWEMIIPVLLNTVK